MTDEQREERRQKRMAYARIYNKKYYAANQEKRKLVSREYYAANVEKVSAYNKKYREANRECIALYKAANRERDLARIKVHGVGYREKNKARIAEQHCAYREDNPEKLKLYFRKHRVRKLFTGIPDATLRDLLVETKVVQLNIKKLLVVYRK